VLLAVSVLLAVRTVGTTGKRTRIRQKARGGAIIGSGQPQVVVPMFPTLRAVVA
jgi:hypothetical protein